MSVRSVFKQGVHAFDDRARMHRSSALKEVRRATVDLGRPSGPVPSAMYAALDRRAKAAFGDPPGFTQGLQAALYARYLRLSDDGRTWLNPDDWLDRGAHDDEVGRSQQGLGAELLAIARSFGGRENPDVVAVVNRLAEPRSMMLDARQAQALLEGLKLEAPGPLPFLTETELAAVDAAALARYRSSQALEAPEVSRAALGEPLRTHVPLPGAKLYGDD